MEHGAKTVGVVGGRTFRRCLMWHLIKSSTAACSVSSIHRFNTGYEDGEVCPVERATASLASVLNEISARTFIIFKSPIVTWEHCLKSLYRAIRLLGGTMEWWSEINALKRLVTSAPTAAETPCRARTPSVPTARGRWQAELYLFGKSSWRQGVGRRTANTKAVASRTLSAIGTRR
jgi:hypothetical protein